MPARHLVPLLVAVLAVAATGGWAMAAVLAAALAGVLGSRRRPSVVHAPPPPVDGPAWGYEFPWLDQVADPGVAYVGITTRPPGVDGRLPRWDDEGHHAQRADVDMGRAVVYVFASEDEAESWETWRIGELAAAGHSLLNVSKNPGRPAWEKLGYGYAA